MKFEYEIWVSGVDPGEVPIEGTPKFLNISKTSPLPGWKNETRLFLMNRIRKPIRCCSLPIHSMYAGTHWVKHRDHARRVCARCPGH